MRLSFRRRLPTPPSVEAQPLQRLWDECLLAVRCRCLSTWTRSNGCRLATCLNMEPRRPPPPHPMPCPPPWCRIPCPPPWCRIFSQRSFFAVWHSSTTWPASLQMWRPRRDCRRSRCHSRTTSSRAQRRLSPQQVLLPVVGKMAGVAVIAAELLAAGVALSHPHLLSSTVMGRCRGRFSHVEVAPNCSVCVCVHLPPSPNCRLAVCASAVCHQLLAACSVVNLQPTKRRLANSTRRATNSRCTNRNPSRWRCTKVALAS